LYGVVKLGDILDDRQAMKFADKLFTIYNEFKSSSSRDKSKKRKVSILTIYGRAFHFMTCGPLVTFDVAHQSMPKFYVPVAKGFGNY